MQSERADLEAEIGRLMAEWEAIETGLADAPESSENS
jgi:hypothetical protein